MSFMDEMRQHHQDTAARQHDEHQRLVDISHQIIRDEIGHNYRNTLLAEIKESAKQIFARKGKIEVLHLERHIVLDNVTECDIPTIEAYLKTELDAALDMFDAEVDGAWRHEDVYHAPRLGIYPARAISAIGHRYIAPPDEYSQPCSFNVSITASYKPPLT